MKMDKIFEKIIYWKKEEGIVINNISDYFNTSGIWALYGRKKETKDYECLNVGYNKAGTIGNEILYDIACLSFLKEWNPNNHGTECFEYINQYAESCNFKYERYMQIETLYRILSVNYENFAFVYVDIDAKRNKEKQFAWSSHALFWRDSHPFKHIEEGYYAKYKNMDENVNDSYIEKDRQIREFLKGN